MDRSEHLISFVTPEALDRADTNGVADLYAYERTTGLRILLSRATGYRGAATGVTSVSSLTRNGRFAIFGTADGVFRRDILTGRTTRISGGAFVNAFVDEYGETDFRLKENAYADDFASLDGRVVATTAGIVTPTGVVPVGANDYGEPFVPRISENGRVAVYQADGLSLDATKRIDTTTGATDTIPRPAALEGRFGVFRYLTPTGQAGYFVTLKPQDGGFVQELVRWNFATGEITVINLPQGPFSRNEKFALTGISSASGPIVIVPAPGVRLPGTVDPPSPNAYVNFRDECTYTEPARSVTVSPTQPSVLPPTASTRFRVRNAAGTVLLDQTIPTPAPEDDIPTVTLPVGTAAYRLDVTVRLVDGRVITERTDRPALPAGEVC